MCIEWTRINWQKNSAVKNLKSGDIKKPNEIKKKSSWGKCMPIGADIAKH